jgi:hypothetical protein
MGEAERRAMNDGRCTMGDVRRATGDGRRKMSEPSEYCRELETYLCRKNEGHLIRIVGPAFEQVCGWAERGVPLAVAKKGIDQYCERYYAKGPRRRPVRIEFCEADILDLFDAWRRAVGVSNEGEHGDPSSARRDTLPAHLDRVIARLTALRGGGGRSAGFDAAIADAVRQLDTMRAAGRQARGAERASVIERLAAVDARLMEVSRAELPADETRALIAAAGAEIAPFAGRMSPDARETATTAAFDRLVRDAIGLPVVTFE